MNNNNLIKVYGTSKERKGMTKAEREQAISAYVQYTKNNVKDNGKHGKIYEVEVRNLLIPNTTVLSTQSLGKSDIIIKDRVKNKMQKIEVKTGGGTLFYNINLPENWKEVLTKELLIELLEQQFDYIIYNTIFDGSSKSFMNGRAFTPHQFIEWLDTYSNGFQSMITYKSKEKKLAITNPKASKKRIQFFNTLVDYGLDIFQFMNKLGLE